MTNSAQNISYYIWTPVFYLLNFFNAVTSNNLVVTVAIPEKRREKTEKCFGSVRGEEGGRVCAVQTHPLSSFRCRRPWHNENNNIKKYGVVYMLKQRSRCPYAIVIVPPPPPNCFVWRTLVILLREFLHVNITVLCVFRDAWRWSSWCTKLFSVWVFEYSGDKIRIRLHNEPVLARLRQFWKKASLTGCYYTVWSMMLPCFRQCLLVYCSIVQRCISCLFAMWRGMCIVDCCAFGDLFRCAFYSFDIYCVLCIVRIVACSLRFVIDIFLSLGTILSFYQRGR